MIVFVGDSITANWPLQNYLPGAINKGVAGETSYAMTPRFPGDTAGASAVHLLAGTNDVWTTTGIENIYRMAMQARMAYQPIMLCTIPPVNGAMLPWVVRHEKSFNDNMRELAVKYAFPLVDYHGAMIAQNGEQNLGLFQDATHPNMSGYSVMFATLKPYINGL